MQNMPMNIFIKLNKKNLMKAKIFSVIIDILLVSVTGMAYETANSQQSGDTGQDELIIKDGGLSGHKYRLALTGAD